jgi:hypothetical protein
MQKYWRNGHELIADEFAISKTDHPDAYIKLMEKEHNWQIEALRSRGVPPEKIRATLEKENLDYPSFDIRAKRGRQVLNDIIHR